MSDFYWNIKRLKAVDMTTKPLLFYFMFSSTPDKVVRNSEVLPGIELGDPGAQGRDASLYGLEDGSSTSLNMRG